MNKRLKLICCDVLFRMACRAAARSKNIIDMEFTRLQSHNEPDKLRAQIQGLIDGTDGDAGYDAVLLGYGLCGNSTAGLAARGLPLVIPRAHDCCTLFLGSRENFIRHFGERLSSQWSSHGYLERNKSYTGGAEAGKGGDSSVLGMLGVSSEYAELVEQYGEDNAAYLWETLHPAHAIGKDERIYIDVAPFDNPEDGDFHFKRFEQAVMAELNQPPHETGSAAETRATGPESAKQCVGAPVIQRVEGSARLIDKLLDGDWDGDFLIAPPGASIAAVYDMEQILTSAPSGGASITR